MLLSPKRALGVADVERAYAAAFGVHAAVLLPSNRAGILLVLTASTGPKTLVTGPAYTCNTVHHAMRLSGARLQFLDTAPNQFLMGVDDLLAAAEGDSCQILSEIYGIPYDDKTLRAGIESRTRIWDMAHGIPDPARLQRMHSGEVAIVSFGMGKCMAAGRGGIAFFNDKQLAENVRKLRDASVTSESNVQCLRDGATILAKVIGRRRAVYRCVHTAVTALRRAARKRAEPRCASVGSEPSSICTPGPSQLDSEPEWTLPMSAINRKFAMCGLRRMKNSANVRRRNAEVYYECLKDLAVVRGVVPPAWPQSNFPIRIPAAFRRQMQHYLRRRGVDTGMIFPFFAGPGLDRERFPNAAAVGGEILTLPLGEEVSSEEVKWISQCVVDGLRDLQVKMSDF
ncbi:MAG: DegT/DnrJ/EryC1/StrS family aminotransferase [Thermoguttaceae bacterium]